MYVIKHILILLLPLLFCSAGLRGAEPIRMGLHLSAPWSFYNAQGALDGIEYQLVSRIFSRAGYQVEYELHNYSRLIKQFSEKKLDCASPVAVPVEGAHFSQPYLPFQDVAISLRQAGVLLNNLDDLAGKRIVAYQQAQQVLGPDFIRATAKANYMELAQRDLQLELLFSARVDVVIGEKRVLHYLAHEVAPQRELTTHYIFAEHAYPAACWREDLTATFNAGLAKLEQSGELAEILQLYHQFADVAAK